MNVIPMGRRILIKPEQQGGVIQTTENNLIERGTVIAVGDACSFVVAGDRLLFTSFGIDSVEVDGERYYFLLESDEFVLAKENVETV